MMIKPVRTAVVGCGNISDAYLTTMMNRFKVLEVVGCCDRSPDKAQAQAQKYGLKVLAIEEILADDSIELVVNLTAPTAHYAVIKQLLEVLHGIVKSSETRSNHVMQSTFEKTPPIPRGYTGPDFFKFIAEVGIAV